MDSIYLPVKRQDEQSCGGQDVTLCTIAIPGASEVEDIMAGSYLEPEWD